MMKLCSLLLLSPFLFAFAEAQSTPPPDLKCGDWQGMGIGSCFPFKYFGACTGQCSFIQQGNTCNIQADGSKCTEGSSTVYECDCRVSGRWYKFCYDCSATYSDYGDFTVTVQDAPPTTTGTSSTPTIMSGEDVEPLGLPDIDESDTPCATEYMSFFQCFANEGTKEESACKDFDPSIFAGGAATEPMSSTCCESDLKAIADCAASKTDSSGTMATADGSTSGAVGVCDGAASRIFGFVASLATLAWLVAF